MIAGSNQFWSVMETAMWDKKLGKCVKIRKTC